jgi:hypothetical protein
MASWPRLIVVCSVLLVGCSADSISATSAESTLPGSPALPMHTTEATTAETQPGTTQQEPPPTATTSSTTTATEAVTTTTIGSLPNSRFGSLVTTQPQGLSRSG